MSPTDTPFSGIASAYDRTFSDLPHVRALRARVQQLMLRYFRPGGSVLEIGCGTGIDAAFLSNHGFRVIATDPAPGMLAAARERSTRLHAAVTLVRMPASHLAAIREGSMDAIYSNFGGLNCIEHLEPVIVDAWHVLRDNGMMILCLMNRFSITETLAYIQHGMFRRALARWRAGAANVAVGSQYVLTWYHSLRDIKRICRGRFMIRSVVGLNVLTPPPSFVRVYSEHPRLIALADALERRLDRLPVFSTLGDHFVVVLERFE